MSINLEKRKPLNLTKAAGPSGLTAVIMGLGWDRRTQQASGGFFGRMKASTQGDIDLDANAILMGSGRVLDKVNFSHLRSNDGCVQHSGDNLTGEGAGDDEQIFVALTRVPAEVDTILFTVTSYRGDTFDKIQNAFVRAVNGTTNQELARYDLGAGDYTRHTGQIMAALKRQGAEWELVAIGEGADGKTVEDHLAVATRY